MPAPASGRRYDGHLSANSDRFELDGNAPPVNPEFELELLHPEPEQQPAQTELWLPEQDPEQPADSPQLELEGMAPPVFNIQLDDGRQARFQHAANLLSSLEAQHIEVHYQCREGYCGSCRATLLSGEVHYAEEPMAWVNEDEILLCCCIPRTNLHIRIND